MSRFTNSVLLLCIAICCATLWTSSSAENQCPSTCECEIDGLRCEHGHHGFPSLSNRSDFINFEFSDCFLDSNLTSVPYPQAESLIIHNCALTSIAGNAFRQTPLIDKLAVTGNLDLTTIDAAAFRGMLHLIDLDLSGNALGQLPDGVFDNLPVLQRLEISGNRLHFTVGLFGASVPLVDLSCNECWLDALPTAALSRLQSLEHLELNRNNFVSLAENQFTSLAQLSSLSLDNSRISTISVGAFNGLGNLTALRLSHNRLMSLSDGVFNGLVRLQELELYHNLLTSLPVSLLTSWKRLSHLRLGFNAWTCDCQTVWMLELKNVVDKSSVECSQPASVHGQQLFNLTATEMCPALTQNTSASFQPAMTVVLALVLCLALITGVGCGVHRLRSRNQRKAASLKYNVLHEAV
jgi:hypothetical protein